MSLCILRCVTYVDVRVTENCTCNFGGKWLKLPLLVFINANRIFFGINYKNVACQVVTIAR